MPLPEINSLSPGDVYLTLEMTDVGTAGGANGTIRFASPMRGYVKMVAVCPANPITTTATTFTVKCGALTAMTSAHMGALMPITVGERGYHVFYPPRTNPLNFFERGALLTIASGGETDATSTARIHIVLGVQ